MVVVNPLIEALRFLYNLVGSYGVAIIVFTFAVRLILIPLTMQSLKSSKAMQELQPQIQAIQKKYAKEKEKLSQETMKLYQEHGVNPLSGCLPTLIQMPIWIGLYSALLQLSTTPEFASSFLWIENLAAQPNTADPLHHVADFILPVLCVVTQYITQKMMTPAVQDPQAQSMNAMMSFMPLMFGFFALSVPAGLVLYWVASNLFSGVQQFFTTGWGSLAKWLPPSVAAMGPQSALKPSAKTGSAVTKSIEEPVRIQAPARTATPTPPPAAPTAAPGAKTVQVWDQVTEPLPSPEGSRKPKKGK
jgi:YidC/Oxa1 family membrane protein insertase